MTTAKVDIKIGALSFAGEGDKEWLSKQLDKVISHAPELLQTHSSAGEEKGEKHSKGKSRGSGKVGTLASFLASKNAKSNGTKKFVATAEWLHLNGNERLTPADVTKALDENSQGKVTNPALVLKRNIKKGYCVKSGSEFYVTDEGRSYLG